MKNFPLAALCCAALLVCLQQSPARAQQAAAAAPEARGHQVALIDMAHVFKNYKKFTAMTESLQKEIEQTDGEDRHLIEQIRQLQGQLTSGNLQEGSADYQKIESQLLQAQTELESFKRVAQRDFLRKEADIYKTVYLEVEDAVARYASYFKYTLVLRFDRQKITGAENPRDIINGMNRQVVYFREQDDITDKILSFLNTQWQQQNGSAAPAGPPRSATDPAGRGTTR